jgi:hypothetical protein
MAGEPVETEGGEDGPEREATAVNRMEQEFPGFSTNERITRSP